jgi:hypothetical protein
VSGLYIRHHKPTGIRRTASVLGTMREDTLRDERFEVTVTFDELRGYVATAAELRQPVMALSLGGLRRKIEIALLPDDVDVRLVLVTAAAAFAGGSDGGYAGARRPWTGLARGDRRARPPAA